MVGARAAERIRMTDSPQARVWDLDPPARVRRSCARVGQHARTVRVAPLAKLTEQIVFLLDRLPTMAAEAWRYQVEHHLDPGGLPRPQEQAAAYMLALAAINYGSGYASWLKRDPPTSTYYTVSSRLARAFIPYRLDRADALSALSLPDLAGIFGQDLDEPRAAELMRRFQSSLSQVAALLRDRHEGSALRFLQSAQFDAVRIVEALSTIPTFDDRCAYDNGRHRFDVFFYKKAQLFAADIARLGRQYGFWDVAGVERLTLFADNAVAQVLRALGAVVVAPDLAARIEAGEALDVCERDEVELRACTVNAGHMLLDNLRRHPSGRKLTIIELDFFLWHIAHEPEYLHHRAIKRHLTLGEFY